VAEQSIAQPFLRAAEAGLSHDAEFHVIEIDPQVDPRWRAFVAAHPDGLIYHHPAWLQVIEQAYRYEPINLAYEDTSGQLLGILPLFRTRGLVTGRTLSSLPHTPVAGILAQSDKVAAALVRAAVERVRADSGTRLQLKMPSAVLNGLVDDVVGVPWEETYVLELPQRTEELRFGNSRNRGRIKWAINKAAKLGVQVRPAESERELRAWFQLYLETMRWHHIPPRPYRFFQAAWEIMRPPGLMRLLLAEQHEAGQSRLLAGSLFLMFGRSVFYAFNGRRREDLSFRPNDILQWQAIHDACEDNFRCYDFGEVEENQSGLAEFKSKWGAERRRMYRYYYPAPSELGSVVLKSNGYARRITNAAWERLPLKMTAVMGEWLHRAF
jgi:hypothetical protein